jgi:hypothetical protein
MAQASRALTVDEGGLPVSRRLACMGKALGGPLFIHMQPYSNPAGFHALAGQLPANLGHAPRGQRDRRAINVRGGQPTDDSRTDDSRHVDIGEEGGVRVCRKRTHTLGPRLGPVLIVEY